MRSLFLSSALAASVSAHGLIRSIEGANGVSMPGLTVADGTPRNCVVNACGAQADTGIIRDQEMASGDVGGLGKTQGNGKVDPANVVSVFMGKGDKGKAPTNKGASGATGVEDDLRGLAGAARNQRRELHRRQMNQLFNLPGIGVAGLGGESSTQESETIVGDMAGQGASKGLPTCDDDGVVNLVYRQINQDGAGPLTAAVDSTSGGYDYQAFQDAEVVQNMPGLGISGLSAATSMNYPVKVRMAPDTVCNGKVGGADKVCVVRVRNEALAGPFGGAAAFTQSPKARKRAIAFRLRKRFEFGSANE